MDMIVGCVKRSGHEIEKRRAVARIKRVLDYGVAVDAVFSDIDDRFHVDGFEVYFNKEFLGYITYMDAVSIPADDFAIRVAKGYAKGDL